jgi:non-canonical poly(A) RNA polymerase PAPD5/7
MDFIAFSDEGNSEVPKLSRRPVSSISAELEEAPWLAIERARHAADHVNLDKSSSPLIRLHNEILSLCDLVEPTESEHKARAELIIEMRSFAEQLFPGCQVQVFGSQLTSILTPTSDLDLVRLVFSTFVRSLNCNWQAFLNVAGDPTEALYSIESAILQKGIATYVEVIANAKVPIVKMDHAISGISIDILINNSSGYETGKLIKKYVRDYPPLRPLTIALKIYLV